MPFKPGQSGNPGGRRVKDREVERLAKEATPEAIQALKAALNVKGERVAAAVALLDRGWGKPKQEHDVTVFTDPNALSDADLAAIAAGGGEDAAAPADGQGQPGGVVH